MAYTTPITDRDYADTRQYKHSSRERLNMYKFTENQLIQLMNDCIALRDEYSDQHGYDMQRANAATISDMLSGLEAERELVDTGAMEQATAQTYCAKQLEPRGLDRLVQHVGMLADIASRNRYPGQLNEIRLRADVLAINLLDEQRRLSSRTTLAIDPASAALQPAESRGQSLEQSNNPGTKSPGN